VSVWKVSIVEIRGGGAGGRGEGGKGWGGLIFREGLRRRLIGKRFRRERAIETRKGLTGGLGLSPYKPPFGGRISSLNVYFITKNARHAMQCVS
jgi:hypothetical protein